jgi:adenylate cyclase
MVRKNIIITGIVLSLFFIIFYIIYSNFRFNFIEYFELKSYDMRYQINEIFKTNKDKTREYDVIIVGIDEKSLLEIGKWPWRRDVHSDLLKKLREYNVKSIGFDISFTEDGVPEFLENYKKELKKTTGELYKNKKIDEESAVNLLTIINELTTDEDYKFAEDIKKSKNVSVGTYNILKEEEYDAEKYSNSMDYINSRFYYMEGIVEEIIEEQRTGRRRANYFKIEKIIAPVDIIGKYCYGIAPFEVGTPDPDGVLRGIAAVTYENKTKLYFPPLYLLVYLNSLNYSMEKNVLLDMKKSNIDIYENALEKKNLFRRIPTNKNGYQRLWFYGMGHTFKYISYTDIINNRSNKKEFENKIVLIGYTDSAKGLYDLRATPIDPNTPGVELHATAIQNLVDGKFMKRADILFHIIIMGIVIGVITIIFALKKIKARSANLIVFLIILGYVLFVYIFFKFGIWIELFYPISCFIIIYIVMNAQNYLNEEVEKKYIRNLFSHYISPQLIEKLIENPEMLKLGGEKKVLTAFFSDIRGFTSISEKMKPEELVEFLNEYLSEMTQIILINNGTIDKYIGDAVMGIFGAPVYSENHAVNACIAAIEYQEKLKLLREKEKNRGNLEIYARIGINTGEMVVGNMGCSIGEQSKFNYTVIGDEVNLASRLEGANKFYGTEIMISEATYNYAKEYIEVRELDRIKVKGKSNAVTVYELMGKKELLSEELKELKKIYEEGIEYYKIKDWKKAEEIFKMALKKFPNDGPIKLYLERVIEFIKNPPLENWDGSFEYETK